MNEFFDALKSDLTNRRIVPFVALAVLALLGAIAYLAFAGGGSPPSTPTAAIRGASVAAGVTGGLPVSQTTPEKSVAETTDGALTQRQGSAHNPFEKLPPSAREKAAAAKLAAAARKSAAAGVSAAAGSGSGSTTKSGSTPKSGESEPATPAKPANPGKPQTVYHVAVLFGITPATATPPGTPLTPYPKLKLQAPLPSATQPLLVFRGVTSGGKSATFTLVGEAILHGNAACLPSASQCQAVDLKAGRFEQFEVAQNGLTVTYELQVVSITSSKAPVSSLKDLLRKDVSKAGSDVLRHAGLLSIPYLSYSSQPGVLVFAAHRGTAARAHAAIRAHRGR